MRKCSWVEPKNFILQVIHLYMLADGKFLFTIHEDSAAQHYVGEVPEFLNGFQELEDCLEKVH